VVLPGRLRDALYKINPDLPEEAVEEAIRKVLTPQSPALIENNRHFHRMLTEGVDVSWMGPEGVRHDKVWHHHIGLTEDETAFYNALAANESAVEVLGDETLKTIAQELVERVHKSVSIIISL